MTKTEIQSGVSPANESGCLDLMSPPPNMYRRNGHIVRSESTISVRLESDDVAVCELTTATPFSRGEPVMFWYDKDMGGRACIVSTETQVAAGRQTYHHPDASSREFIVTDHFETGLVLHAYKVPDEEADLVAVLEIDAWKKRLICVVDKPELLPLFVEGKRIGVQGVTTGLPLVCRVYAARDMSKPE